MVCIVNKQKKFSSCSTSYNILLPLMIEAHIQLIVGIPTNRHQLDVIPVFVG
jgi:hypothetical protein